ncbi:MAG: PQQ-binding-like beta-propeller repeat protein [SAR324 cluster bacterium]|nr:PQQ-binding-like beta-propeller repeat protein [SAR324 cluster bacterium]
MKRILPEKKSHYLFLRQGASPLLILARIFWSYHHRRWIFRVFGCFIVFTVIQIIHTDIRADGFQHGEISLLYQWSLQTEGPFNQAPEIRGNKVYGIPQKGALFSLKLDDGTLIWKKSIQAGWWDRTLALDEEKVYAASRKAGLFAFDLNSGKEIWRTDLGIQVQVRPLPVNGVVYTPSTHVGTDIPSHHEKSAKLFALDAVDGSILWAHESHCYALQTPFYRNGVIYLAGSYFNPQLDIDEGGPMSIEALDAETGEILWLTHGTDGFVKSIYATDHEVIYIGYQDFVNGLSRINGVRIWRRDTGNWVPDLAGLEGYVYFGSANTMVHARRTADGSAIWEYNIPWGSFNYLLGKPVIEEGRLYFLTQRGQVLALNQGTGAPLWYAQTGLASRTGLGYGNSRIVIGDMKGKLHTYLIPKSIR